MAALDPSVVGTHRVGDRLMVVMELDVHTGGELSGASVAELREQGMDVVAWRRGEAGWTLQASPDHRVLADERVQIMVPGDQVDEVHAANRG